MKMPHCSSIFLTKYDFAAIQDADDLVSWSSVCFNLQEL